MSQLSITKTNNNLRATIRRRSRLVIAKAARGAQGVPGQNGTSGATAADLQQIRTDYGDHTFDYETYVGNLLS